MFGDRQPKYCRLPALVACLSMVFIGCSAAAQCTEGCIAIHTLTGEAAGDQFGWKSNYVGDLNGDGVLEFVITAPTHDANGADSGRIYVYSAADGVELWRADGLAAFANLGIDANRLGDVTGDGIPDVIAGAPGAGTGTAHVFSGADGSLVQSFAGIGSGDQFGNRVAGDGDVNGDGVPDLLIASRFDDTVGTNAGRVFVYSGVDFSLLCKVDGESSFDEFGTALSFVGDINADGNDDFVVGARQAGPTSGGEAYVYSYDGRQCNLLHNFESPVGAIDYGHLFADGGRDINADGTPDVYVADFSANRAYVYSGADFSLLWMLSGDNEGGFGLGEMIDDVNGDGHDDLVLAAWTSDLVAADAGKIFVYSGADGGILETFTHDIPGATFGFDVNGLGDVNNDGLADYLITAAWDLNQQGRAYVIAGTVGPPLAGDINGDGSVGTTDLLLLLGAWGPCGDCDACPADLNDDCIVGTADLIVLLGNWG